MYMKCIGYKVTLSLLRNPYTATYMKDYIFLLGREPLLSMAELVSIFGISVSRDGEFASVTCEEAMIQTITNCLGGTIKIGEVVWK